MVKTSNVTTQGTVLCHVTTQGTVLCVALSVTDSAGRSVTYTYEGDLLTSVTNPDGDSLTYSYDENGYLSSARDFEGEEYVRNTYDEKGRVTYQVYMSADAEVVNQFSYDDENLVNTLTDGSGKVTE